VCVETAPSAGRPIATTLPLSWLALSMKDESVPDVRHVRDRHGPAARPWGEQDLYGLLRGLELLPNEPISF
jgi:hypothetical protein